MNCKPGDLAFISAPGSMADGTVVQCVAFAGDVHFMGRDGPYIAAAWLLDRHYITYAGGLNKICPDKYLRPIRPQSDDATDEMLLIAGKPEGVTA